MKPHFLYAPGFLRWTVLHVKAMTGAMLASTVVVAMSAANPVAKSGMTGFGSHPISFEQNLGQAGDEARFIARGPAYYFSLSPTEATVSLRKFDSLGGSAYKNGRARSSQAGGFRSVRLQFVGANPQAAVSGESELSGQVNYFIGSDAAKWRMGVSLFTRVRVTDMYPGISLVHYGNQQHLEYDFEVAPGVDPSVIAIRFEGADCITINSDGDLVLTLGDDEIRQPKPVVYQKIGDRKKEIQGDYVLSDSQTVKFALGKYDPRETLVIDPVLSYSTYYGGTGLDVAWAVAVDAAGFVYVAGETMAGLPVTSGTFTNQFGGAGTGLHGDAFVAKFDSSFSNLVYLTYVGGTYDDVAFGLAVDAGGSAYITGYTDSQNFPRTNAIFNQIKGTPYPPPVNIYPLEAFVTKLGPSGTNLIYSTYLGGSGTDLGFGIAVDPMGNAYVAGFTQSSDFPTANVTGGFTNYSGGFRVNDDAFVAKIGPAGTNLIYSMYLGGTSVEWARDVAADAAGQAYVTGFTLSQNFPVTTNNAIQPWLAGSADAFVTVVGAFGSNLITSTYLGGAASNLAYRITLDANTNIYLTGVTYGDSVYPVSPSLINPGGVFRSSNGAMNWTPANNGLQSVQVLSLAIDPANPSRLYAGTSRGIARSIDGGVTWDTTINVAPMPQIGNLGPAIAIGSVWSIAVDYPIFGQQIPIVYAGTSQGVFKSTDAGTNWFLNNTNLNNSSTRSMVISTMLLSNSIFSAGNAGVYRSSDGGTNWLSANTGLGNMSVRAVAKHPVMPMVLFAATAGGVYRTIDSGTNWASAGLVGQSVQAIAIPILGGPIVINPDLPMTLYVGTAAGVFMSTNSGSNWISMNVGLTTSNVTALAMFGPTILYAGTTNGLFKSTNAGSNWTSQTDGLLVADILSLAANPPLGVGPQPPQAVYAGTRGKSFFGGGDVFVTKLGNNGFSTVFGGTGNDEGWDVAVGSAGQVHVVGATTSTDLPTLNTSGFLSATNSGGQDVFVAEFTPSGTALLASAYLGGAANDLGYGIVVNAAGTYIVGETSSGNFPTVGALQGTYRGGRDAFIAHIANTVLNPLLNIQPAGSQVRLSWSALAVDYDLQSNTNLLSASGWANVPVSPSESNGVLSVSLPATNSTQFFRLSNP